MDFEVGLAKVSEKVQLLHHYDNCITIFQLGLENAKKKSSLDLYFFTM